MFKRGFASCANAKAESAAKWPNFPAPIACPMSSGPRLDGVEAGTADLERQLRAATIAVETEESEQRAAGEVARQPEGDAETRERAELRAKVRLGSYVSAAIEQRGAAGAEAEYNQSIGIAGNRFPLELLAPPEQRAARVEDRAVTGRRHRDDAANVVGSVVRRHRCRGRRRHDGIGSGRRVQSPRHHGGRDGGAARQVAGSGRCRMDHRRHRAEAEAERRAAAVQYRGRGKNSGLESALTRDLRMALTEGVDRAIFLGDDTANPNTGDIVGLTTAAGLVEKTITQANKIKGANVLQAFAELIDGKAAMMPSDLKAVFAVGANTLWSHTLANTGASVDTTIAEFLRRFGLNWMTRGEIEIATAAADFGAFVGLGRGLDGAGVAAIWEAGELIRDPYSVAAKGEVALTLIYLWDFALPRASNFARIVFDA